MQESKSLSNAERLKEKLWKQDFHYDLEEVSEPVTVKQAEATKNQKQLSEKQKNVLLTSKPKQYVILLKQQYKQYKTKLVQFENRVKL